MIEEQKVLSKSALARSLGIARSSLYYVSRLDKKVWITKTKMEQELREEPGYGSRRLADALGIGRDQARRVMHKFGIKPYRRRARKWRRKKPVMVKYPNLLSFTMPLYPNHVWAADFTEIWYRGKWVYIATVEDLFTRKMVGIAISLRKGTPLVMQALGAALLHYPRPEIFHSDNGREYDSKAFIRVLEELGIRISRSHPGCPWENGYQESFYDKFKLDFGDPKRFKTYGELVAEIYRRMWAYNHTRIHSVLQMPPQAFAEKRKKRPRPLKNLQKAFLLTCSVFVALVLALTACPKQEKASSGQQNPPTTSQAGQQSATTATQQTSASPNSAQQPNGPRATEKYVLGLTNYAKVPVTVKVNGQWVGQWDNHANVPLDMVVKGENQLTVDLANQPQNTVTVNINTTRDGVGVSILSLNFQGQSGTHTATFVAR